MVLRLNQYVTKKHVISIFYLKFIIIILVIIVGICKTIIMQYKNNKLNIMCRRSYQPLKLYNDTPVT